MLRPLEESPPPSDSISFPVTATPLDRLEVRLSRAEEREAIGRLTREAGIFTQEEIDTVFELFDAAQNDPHSGYNFLSAHLADQVVGFVCWGPTPLTEGAYDLYWICTDPQKRRHGIGRALFERVEREARQEGGRLIAIWTSGTPPYAEANDFYRRVGCELVARIADFYRPGDDLLVWVRRLEAPA